MVVHFLVAPLGVWGAYGVGLLVCIGWSGILWIVRRKL